MLYSNRDELIESLSGVLKLQGDEIIVQHGERLRQELIDILVYNAHFNGDLRIRETAKWLIYTTAIYLNAVPASIESLYRARGQEDYTSKTTLALNLRGFSFDTARAIFRSMRQLQCAPVLFEYGVDEATTSDQNPADFVCAVLAAAIKENHSGPVFLQAGRFCFNPEKYKENAPEHRAAMRSKIKELVDCGFYNIDVDTSTLAADEQETLVEKLRPCFEEMALMSAYIREIEPKKVRIAIGGRATALKHKISSVEEVELFLDGYVATLRREGSKLKGLVKLGIHTRTAEGSRPLPDGRVVQETPNFDAIENITDLMIRNYQLGGVVVHEVSNLEGNILKQLPSWQVLEAHATYLLQDTLLDSKHFPDELREQIHAYLKDSLRPMWNEGITEEQFLYATRKAAFGPFKKKFWDLNSDQKDALIDELQHRITTLMQAFHLGESREFTRKHVKPVEVRLPKPPFVG